MNFFFKQHQDWVLIFIAALFVGIVMGFYVWGIDALLLNVTQAIGLGGDTAPAVKFHTDDAERILRERGLIQ